MSSPIQPTQGATQASAALSAGGAGAARATAASFPLAPAAHLAPADRAVSLDTLPASPPRQVLDEMASAARIHEGLRTIGRELHFAHDEASGRITIEVRDDSGRVLRTLSPAEALDVAAGKPLE